MAYDKKELFDKAIAIIREKKFYFIEDVIVNLPCVKQTFYDHFPLNSDEMDVIKNELEQNKINLKTSMRKKWYDSDNATLQIALMKLISTDEERKRISNTYIDKSELNINGEGTSFNITRKIISDDSGSTNE
jgi:hypothetical protein